MKLIGLRICEHDSNISYYDGNTVRYIKTERIYQQKHHGYSALPSYELGRKHNGYANLWGWKEDFKNIFGDDPDDADEICTVFDPYLYKYPAEPIPFPATEYPRLGDKFHRLDHHYAHALSTVKGDGLHIVIDGFGDSWDRDDKGKRPATRGGNSWSVFRNGEEIDRGYCDEDGSLGIEMIKASLSLGMKSKYYQAELDMPGKLMGLQSYGKYTWEYAKTLPTDLSSVEEIFDRGLYKTWEKKHFGILGNTNLNWIRTVHEHMGDVLVNFFSKYVYHDTDLITYSGGCAQNVIWNTQLKKKFPNLYIPAHCGDEGLSLGCIEYLRRKNNLPELDIHYYQSDTAPKNNPTDETIQKVAQALNDGKIVAWYQGHGEIGPRALGYRSLLINPFIENAKDIINKVKRREMYRPFGASVLAEHQRKYFDTDIHNPHMLYVGNVTAPGLDAITHIDGTCRYQTVTKENEYYYKLLQSLEHPIVLNTSLNLAGKPIMADPNDIKDFDVDIDMVVVGNEITVL